MLTYTLIVIAQSLATQIAALREVFLDSRTENEVLDDQVPVERPDELVGSALFGRREEDALVRLENEGVVLLDCF